jgi:starch-binding outer membrane protein, SusD/RagB family
MKMKKSVHYITAFVSILLALACNKEFENPNATEEQLLKTPEGMVELLVGVKHRFAVNSNLGNGTVFTSISANAFSTFEFGQKAGANQDFNQLSAGGNKLATNNQVITDLWGNCMLVNRVTTSLINNAPIVITDTNVQFQVRRYALFYKAMALGTLANFWEEFPVTTGDKQLFVTRKDALLVAISLLDEAGRIRETSSTFNSAFGTEINVRNTLAALTARYFTMLGYYDEQYFEKARQKALQVPLNSRSVFFYNSLNPNSVFRNGFSAVFGYIVDTNRLGLPEALKPAVTDNRFKFFRTRTPQGGYGFGGSDNDSLPIYLPGEMLLIQAEVWARKGDPVSLDSSKKYLNLVLTKTTDVFRLGAGLPAYSGAMTKEALLTEIYRNRCIELFMSGLKLEDSRRFGRPGPSDNLPERNRTFYPYPFQERYGNPNTPPDPPE